MLPQRLMTLGIFLEKLKVKNAKKPMTASLDFKILEIYWFLLTG